ncbi:MAG TPA: plasmid maintenance system antidote protein [Bacteroidia bacterium]
MKLPINTIKGIHPGFILERELKKRSLAKSRFALQVNEYPQTLVSITKGKRDMNTALALKVEHALGMDEGTLMILQVYYDIEKEKKKQKAETPNLKNLRRVIFWDTDMDKIDWQRQKQAVIKRVFERGNDKEKNEIIRFYGKETIEEIIKK